MSNIERDVTMHDNFLELKNKYKDGYRCIHKQTGSDYTYTLRDFKRGKICTISTNDRMEVGEMEDFLDQIHEIQKKTGHDCICTGYESDN